jgi:hypothetical protein
LAERLMPSGPPFTACERNDDINATAQRTQPTHRNRVQCTQANKQEQGFLEQLQHISTCAPLEAFAPVPPILAV